MVVGRWPLATTNDCSYEMAVPSERSDPRALDDAPRCARSVAPSARRRIARYVPAATLGVHARVIAELKRRVWRRNRCGRGAGLRSFRFLITMARRFLRRNCGPRAAGVVLLSRALGSLLLRADGGYESRPSRELSSAGHRCWRSLRRPSKQSFFMADQHRLRFPC